MTAGEVESLVVGLTALLGVVLIVLWAGQVRLGWAPVTALARGAVQLTVVGLALAGMLRDPLSTGAVLLIMVGTATWTAGGRLDGLAHARLAVLASCVVGSAVAVGVVFALGVLPFSTGYVVAVGGVVIGGTMDGASLAGRHLLAGLRARREEVEAWLALGATPRQAVRDVARAAAGEALVPNMDQTRTTGLVTLPGAFVGALLGGASPLQAARFQLIVLAALLAAQAVVAVLLTTLLGAPTQHPRDRPPSPERPGRSRRPLRRGRLRGSPE